MADEPRNLTFLEKYQEPDLTWQEKAVLISLYHAVMCMKFNTWTLSDTAMHFHVSIGLVSENIRLAKAIDTREYGPKLLKCETREKGLKIIDKRKYDRIKLDD